MLVDLVLDLRGGVAHEDTRVRVRRAHLRLRALERGEELRVEQCGLLVLELRGDVARESEVRILVDRTGDQAGDVSLRAEDLREGVGERGCGLDGCEVNLADVVSVCGRREVTRGEGRQQAWGRRECAVGRCRVLTSR